MSQNYLILQATGADQSDEWVRMGVDDHSAGNLGRAQQRYGQALRLDPRHVEATNNLGILFMQTPGQINEALLAFERATIFAAQSNPAVYMNWSLALTASDRIDEALTASRKALEIAPEDIGAMLSLAVISTTAGMPEVAMPLYNKILDKEPKHPLASPNSCFVGTLADSTPADLLKQRQRWYQANRYDGKKEPHGNERTTDRPLRVGYVGGDFKSHSAAFIFSRVLFHHTAAVEMYLYSSLPVDPVADGKTKRFKELAGERWRDISAMSDEDADKLIRKDRIDILVDLAGHTNGGRLPLFTRKPAPIQVTAWGFAHGTGLPEIDYFLADPVAVPEAERKDFAEKIWDLPSIVTMEEPADYGLRADSQPPFAKNGYMTFGSYARFEKISDTCLKCYSDILRRVPESRLQFKDASLRRPYSLRRVMSFMDGVDPKRVLFSLNTPHNDHLLSMQQCDIALDPYPHGGGVVALETLYMGVPTITMYGKQPSGRTASSILTQMNRTDWIAKSPEEYVAKAVEWADKPKELAAARKTLRKELMESPVVAGYTEKVELAYHDIWQMYCNG